MKTAFQVARTFFLFAALLFIYSVTGATNTWLGVTADWSTGGNWSSGISPSSCSDTVIIPATANNPVISSAVSVGDITVNSGAGITLNANLNVCGNWTGGSAGAGMVTGNGIVVMSGSAAQSLSGNTQFSVMQVSNAAGVSLAAGATVVISVGLQLMSGNFDISAGTLHLLSTSSTNNSYIDDFTWGNNSGSLTGNTLTVDRYVPIAGFNQHYTSSPVNSPSFSQLHATGTDGVYVIPSADCDENADSINSPSGTVFQYNDGHMPPEACMLGNWQVRSAGNTDNGRGYSVYSWGDSILSLTGSANTGDITVDSLNNSGYPTVNTLQGHPMESGWNLVGNPYPSGIDMTIDRTGSGFSDQVQIWQASGPWQGTWQPLLITGSSGSIEIPPFQGFMVRATSGPGMHSYPFHQSERVRSTTVQFYRTAAQNSLQLLLNYNGLYDATAINFNPSATTGFDDKYDANKGDGAKGRPTLYTTTNDNQWYGINSLPPLTQLTTVNVGLHPEVNGTMTLTAQDIESFDPTSYIILEDKKTNIFHNLRNGAYTFTTTPTDNQSRFALHFTPQAEIVTEEPGCTSPGVINISQPGTANWNYTITDGAFMLLSKGILNETNPVRVNASAGVYTLTLTDDAGYAIVKNILLQGSGPVITSMSMGSGAARAGDIIEFEGSAENAVSYAWDFGDGTTGTGNTVRHVYQSAGAHSVTLTITGANGCTSAATQLVSIGSSYDSPIGIWSNENKVYVDFAKLSEVRADISVTDIIGQELCKANFADNTLFSMQVNNIGAGYVIVRVRNKDEMITQKLFITNDK